MKILILTPKPPFPARDGSSLATAQVIEGLAARGHQVHVFFLNTSKHKSSPSDLPGREKIRYTPVSCYTSVRPWPALASLLFSRIPYTVSRFITRDTVNALEELLTNESFDIIQIETLMMTPYLDVVRKHSHAKIIFRPHNIEHIIWSRLAGNERNPLKRFYFRSLARQISNYERSVANRSGHLLPISDSDAAVFREWNPQAQMMVLPYGVVIKKDPSPPPAGPPVLLFLGALDWRPNVLGLEWFLREVWPSLTRRLPQLVFHIAGRNPGTALQKMIRESPSSGKIIFHGEVEHTDDLFLRSNLFIVPLFAGSGIRIKILEAIAHGLAVISTTTGAAGLPLQADKHILIADTPERFLQATEKLVNDPQYCSAIRENALLLLKKKFDREALAGDLETFYLQT